MYYICCFFYIFVAFPLNPYRIIIKREPNKLLKQKKEFQSLIIFFFYSFIFCSATNFVSSETIFLLYHFIVIQYWILKTFILRKSHHDYHIYSTKSPTTLFYMPPSDLISRIPLSFCLCFSLTGFPIISLFSILEFHVHL